VREFHVSTTTHAITVVYGIVGGLAGGVIFGLVQMTGMIPMVRQLALLQLAHGRHPLSL